MNWIEALKPGDNVIISSMYGARIGTVEKITPAGNIKAGGLLFNKSGREKGGDVWHSCKLNEATDESLREINEHEIIANVLSKMRQINSLTYDQAEKILEILKDVK